MKIQQFVMAYKAEQDRIRAMLPEDFESLRPVLRINAEIRTCDDAPKPPQEILYIELNTPVTAFGKRGWLNIDNWQSPAMDIKYEKNGSAVTFITPFLKITYTGVGVEGGCPAEKDNDGCFFNVYENIKFIPAETIDCNKEFCDCEFAWKFTENEVNAHGVSLGEKSVAAFLSEPERIYERQAMTAKNAASIECQQILGAYTVKFER